MWVPREGSWGAERQSGKVILSLGKVVEKWDRLAPADLHRVLSETAANVSHRGAAAAALQPPGPGPDGAGANEWPLHFVDNCGPMAGPPWCLCLPSG